MLQYDLPAASERNGVLIAEVVGSNSVDGSDDFVHDETCTWKDELERLRDEGMHFASRMKQATLGGSPPPLASKECAHGLQPQESRLLLCRIVMFP